MNCLVVCQLYIFFEEKKVFKNNLGSIRMEEFCGLIYFLGIYWSLTLEEDLVHREDGILGGSGVMSCSPFPVRDLVPSGISSDKHGQPCACIDFSGVLHFGDVDSFVFSSDLGFPLLLLRLE